MVPESGMGAIVSIHSSTVKRKKDEGLGHYIDFLAAGRVMVMVVPVPGVEAAVSSPP